MASQPSFTPQVMTRLSKQIRNLASKPPEGIRYLPDEGSLSEIHAVIFGPEDTPYHGGQFHLKLVLGSEYPSAPPKGYFITKIFHPNVSDAGDICVNTLKRDWKPDNTLHHVLQVIRCLLIVPFPESSLNEDAGKLFMESYDEYYRKATLMTKIHAKRKIVESEENENIDKTASVTETAESSPTEASGESTTTKPEKETEESKSSKSKSKKALSERGKKDVKRKKSLKRL
eukprot:gb/GECG01012451.1/.p1 GENE.gb/GECG01012451.1/~~gb/GECG01012451.1/.p1  ORF type:complete len:230 (+),score=23.81 gb/GECG01012451.1/:1-690(+)